MVRQPAGPDPAIRGRFDTLDHELDYWLPAGGGWTVKDDELFEHRVREGRYSAGQAQRIRATGERVVEMLQDEAYWWDPAWSAWQPPAGWTGVRVQPGWDVPADDAQ
ncbi:MAG: hypothetical protein ACRDWY_10295 [Actinomycetes bacterium]